MDPKRIYTKCLYFKWRLVDFVLCTIMFSMLGSAIILRRGVRIPYMDTRVTQAQVTPSQEINKETSGNRFIFLGPHEIGAQERKHLQYLQSLGHGASLKAEKQIETESRVGESSKTQPKMKTILFWNSFFEYEDYRFGTGHLPFLKHKCPVNSCMTTSDRNLLQESDAVLFHGPIVEGFPPPKRFPNQLYTYLQLEPQIDISGNFIPVYNGEMNLTIAYRQDADIWIPYGRIFPGQPLNMRRNEVISPVKRPKSVAWVVSHCETTGKREMYVKELMKHIDVDIYGECGNLNCPKSKQAECHEMFEKKYRFILSFENNHCIDYVSEKLYRPLMYNLIPIVFGGANYTEVAPPHSVINIKDYPKPADLASFLKKLGNSPSEYRKYFAWKDKFDIERNKEILMGDAFCQLCEILHNPGYKFRNYSDLYTWWLRGTCDPQVMTRMRRQNKW